MLNLEEITKIVVFGDSFSDNGNSLALTFGAIPPAPYYLGRFTNGPVAVEYLAQELEIALNPYYDDGVGDNFAVGAAGTGENNSNNDDIAPFLPGVTLPGMATEITAFEQSLGGAGADPNALYIVWGGPNDFLDYLGGSNPVDPAYLIQQGVSNLVDNLNRLMDLGAENLVLANMPPLGLLPFSAGFPAEATAISIAFNSGLALALDNLDLASEPSEAEVIPVDFFALSESIAAQPEAFGLTNITVPYLSSGLPLPTDPTEKTGFLFWDIFHLTTEVHEIFGNTILQTINGELPQPDLNDIAGTSKGENIFGTRNDDNIDGFAGNDIIVGFTGDDRIEGWEGNDWLLGKQGNDILSGGDNQDYLWGEGGDDVLFGGAGKDQIWGERGKDILIGDSQNDTLWGGGHEDYILGGDGNDSLSGEWGNDILHGGKGKDFLLGGSGNDQLNGGEGKDTLIGGAGADLFSLTENQNTDIIEDFKAGVDIIILSGSLTFEQLSFSTNQISVTATGEILATLTGVDTTTLTEVDFVIF